MSPFQNLWGFQYFRFCELWPHFHSTHGDLQVQLHVGIISGAFTYPDPGPHPKTIKPVALKEINIS